MSEKGKEGKKGECTAQNMRDIVRWRLKWFDPPRDKEKTNEAGKTRLLTKISFGAFLVSLLSLLAGCIYSVRFALVKELSDSYLCIVNSPLSDKIVMVLGTIAIISFFVFLDSMREDVDDSGEGK